MGVSLRPQTEHQNNVAAFLKDVRNAPKYNLNPNIRALLHTEDMSDISPNESIRYLAKHGLPFPKPVNEGTYSRAKHVRIDLFFEETDPAKSALRNAAAYQLTATRASAAAITIDHRNTLVLLTVPDAAVRYNAALTL